MSGAIWTKEGTRYCYAKQHKASNRGKFVSLDCCLLLVGRQFVFGFNPRLFFQVNFSSLFWR